MKMRVKHFHEVKAALSADGKQALLQKGHLVASVATIEAGDEVVCVGIARCNPCEYTTGAPLRRIGSSMARTRAKDHLLYETGMLDSEDLRTHEELKEKGLVMTMTRDEFLQMFVDGNPFRGHSYVLDRTTTGESSD